MPLALRRDRVPTTPSARVRRGLEGARPWLFIIRFSASSPRAPRRNSVIVASDYDFWFDVVSTDMLEVIVAGPKRYLVKDSVRVGCGRVDIQGIAQHNVIPGRVVAIADDRLLLRLEFADVAVPHTEPFALALSGGGHRATVFTLGALFALVDLRRNADVANIASVSGGSITSAAVMADCDFATLQPGGLDHTAKRLLHVVTRDGVLTREWMLSLGACLVAVSLFLSALTARILPLPIAIAFALLYLAILHLFTGILIEHRIRHRYFRDRPRSRFEDLSPRFTQHDFCATDLASGQPAYFSTEKCGTLHVRESMVRRIMQDRRVRFVRFESRGFEVPCGKVGLATVVRCSAGFPGIPPRRLSIRPAALDETRKWPRTRRSGYLLRRYNPREQSVDIDVTFGGETSTSKVTMAPQPPPPRRTLWLADGGIWNNLGTHVAREDRARNDLSLLCINASALDEGVDPRLFVVPIVAQVVSVLRSLRILLTNSVVPRVQSMESLTSHETGERLAGASTPAATIVSLTQSPEEVLTMLRGSAASPDDIADQYGHEWHRDIVPLDALDNLTECAKKWKLPPLTPVRTNLTRLPEDVAIALLMRGYLNTVAACVMIQHDLWTALWARSNLYDKDLVPDLEARFRALIPQAKA